MDSELTCRGCGTVVPIKIELKHQLVIPKACPACGREWLTADPRQQHTPADDLRRRAHRTDPRQHRPL
ncbi:MAG: hypothetical protein HY329_13845 [Chloroflexi bacterium]|nr:hypothetical protein [Chloroflexota bacterium]